MIFLPGSAFAQPQELLIISKDSTRYELTPKAADHLASLPLKCILQEFPNKTSHTSNKIEDHIMSPRELHPSFYGCFDWHSCVHGHWMLVKLLKKFPGMAEAQKIRQTLTATLSKANLDKEVKYFSMPLASSWERTYGWAWLLKLAQELDNWNDADGRQWKQNLQPLTDTVVQLWTRFLPKQTYPNRTGVHPNTAFGLTMAYDYAVQTGNTAFKNSIITASKKIYLGDTDGPARWEPNGSDFLSPCLEEADLMRRVLPKSEFIQWFGKFLTTADLRHLSVLPVVSDRADLQIVHLDGLCFSRAWCMKGIARLLPAGDARRALMLKSAAKHLSSALPHVVSGEYGGEHWLASFAVYALLEE